MRNEADKFLHEVISHAARYVDAFLVIDDCSSDNSIEVFRKAAGQVPVYLYSPPQPLYLRSEFYIRSLQWALTAELNPSGFYFWMPTKCLRTMWSIKLSKS